MVIGTDIVSIPAFAEQLTTSGSRFELVFTPMELRIAAGKPNRAAHLAGRWAAKEALVKAWGQARYGQPPLLADTPEVFAQIEVVPDPYGRVAYRLHGEVATLLVPKALALSISHDGDVAIAQCLLEL